MELRSFLLTMCSRSARWTQWKVRTEACSVVRSALQPERLDFGDFMAMVRCCKPLVATPASGRTRFRHKKYAGKFGDLSEGCSTHKALKGIYGVSAQPTERSNVYRVRMVRHTHN